jgi:hypothetical protein
VVGQPDGWPAPSTNREHTRWETQAFYLFLGVLGSLGVLGVLGVLGEACLAHPRIAEKRLKTSLRQSISGGMEPPKTPFEGLGGGAPIPEIRQRPVLQVPCGVPFVATPRPHGAPAPGG